MSDMEQGWKPNGRPQSAMALAFSTALDSVFELDSEVDHLSQTIDQKKFQMLLQERELEKLQAKIREAEERLKARQSRTADNTGSESSASTEKGQGEYRSESSASDATSPTDTAGQYSSSDEQHQQGQERNS